MRKNLKKIVIAVFLLLCVGLLFIPNKFNNYLSGTYTSSELPFSMMSFDSRDNTFYYYYPNEDNLQIEDKGNYSKQNEGEYVIQSGIFKDTRVICADNSFYININGSNFQFRRISELPTVILKE